MSDLKSGQWQIGNLVFGRGTNVTTVGVDQIGYEVTPGDYSIPQSDEIRFRRDFIKPGVIQFSLAIVDNYILPGMGGDPLTETGMSADETMELFRKEWRADEIRSSWGWVKPLTYRGPGVTRVLFGRPRNIATDRRKTRPGWYRLTCSYQLSDALSYSEGFYVRPVAVNAPKTLVSRDQATAPAWMTIILQGPAVRPVIELGGHKMTFDLTLAPGEVLTVISEPWQRQATVNRSNGAVENVSWRMVDNSAYIEDIRFTGLGWMVGCSATGTTSETQMMVGWREAYHAI